MKGRESGSVLVWVMVVGLFTVGALGAAMRLIPAGTQFSAQDSDTTYAFIAAESGVNYVVHYLKKHGIGRLEEGWTATGDLGDLFDGGFSVVSDGDYIYVTGKYGSATRTLRAKALTMDRGPKPKFELDVAVFAVAGPGARYPTLDLAGGAQVLGTGGTNSVASGAVRLKGGSMIHGDVIVGPLPAEQAESAVSIEHWMTLPGEIVPMEARDYPLPVFPQPFSDLPMRGSVSTNWDRTRVVIDEPGQYDSITAGSGNYKIVFDTRGGDLRVRTKSLKVHGAGMIEIVGGGRLFLFVEQTLDFASGSFNVDGDPMSAVVYYAGSSKLNLAGGFRFKGIIYAQDANVDLAGSFGPDAWVLSGGRDVKIAGGANLGTYGIIYAPHAHVVVAGGATTGIVIGNSVSVSGGAHITHRPLDFGRLPLEFPFADGEDETEGTVENLEWQLCWTDCLTAS